MRTLGKTVCFLSLMASCSLSHAKAQSDPPEFPVSIDDLASEAIAAGAMPGLSVAIAYPDGRVTARAYGRLSQSSVNPIGDGSVFRIGSISKLITAAVIMKLAEDGQFSLETSVRELLRDRPEFDTIPVSVTVESLLNHTSGLPDFTMTEIEAGVERGEFTDDDLRIVLRRPPLSQPGEAWRYSDTNYRLLSLIIEKASGLPYHQFITEKFAAELGLGSIKECQQSDPDLVTGYIAMGNQLVVEPAYKVKGLLGEGGLCATVIDLAALPSKLVSGEWINSRSLSLMLRATALDNGIVVDYGFGVRGGQLGSVRTWGHAGGGLNGAWAALAHYPDTQITIAVVANGTGSGIDASVLQAKIAEQILGPFELQDITPDKKKLDRVTGIFSRGDDLTCILISEEGLVRKRAGSRSPPTRLIWQRDQTFRRSDFPLDSIVFQAGEKKSPAYQVYYDGLFAEYWTRVADRLGDPEC